MTRLEKISHDISELSHRLKTLEPVQIPTPNYKIGIDDGIHIQTGLKYVNFGGNLYYTGATGKAGYISSTTTNFV